MKTVSDYIDLYIMQQRVEEMEFRKLMDSFHFHYSSDSEFNQDQSLDSS